jgi:hypothetical protein
MRCTGLRRRITKQDAYCSTIQCRANLIRAQRLRPSLSEWPSCATPLESAGSFTPMFVCTNDEVRGSVRSAGWLKAANFPRALAGRSTIR